MKKTSEVCESCYSELCLASMLSSFLVRLGPLWTSAVSVFLCSNCCKGHRQFLVQRNIGRSDSEPAAVFLKLLPNSRQLCPYSPKDFHSLIKIFNRALESISAFQKFAELNPPLFSQAYNILYLQQSDCGTTSL